jgi:hypothetical protein
VKNFLRRLGAAVILFLWPIPAVAITMYAGVGGPADEVPSDQQGRLLIVNQTTGAGTIVGDPVTLGGLAGIAFDSSGALFGSTINFPTGSGGTSRLVRIDPDTGGLITDIGPIRDGLNGPEIPIGDLAFQPGTDVLFGLRSDADEVHKGGLLYTIDTTTGVARLIGPTGSSNLFGGGLAFAPDGTLYQTGLDPPSPFLQRIDPNTAMPIGPRSPLSLFFDGLAVRPTDDLLFAIPEVSTGDDRIHTIDPANLTVIPVGSTGAGKPSDLDFRLQDVQVPVPVPGTLIVLAGGLIAIVGLPRSDGRRYRPPQGANR